MDVYEYVDSAGRVTRVMTGDFREAESGMLDGDVSYRLLSSNGAGLGAVLTLKQVIASAKSRIDGAASRARSRYLTTGVGQEWVYQAKLAQAQDYLAALDSANPLTSAEAWPYVYSEAHAKGIGCRECASQIVAAGSTWMNVVSPGIEALRVSAKQNVDTKSTIDEVSQYLKDVVLQLDNM